MPEAQNTKLAAIVPIARPEGQRKDYRFYKSDKGTSFKATFEMNETLSRDPVINVTISKVGADGKAILNNEGEVELFTQSHTFTITERSSEGFDLPSRVNEIMATLVAQTENQIASKEAIQNIDSWWQSE